MIHLLRVLFACISVPTIVVAILLKFSLQTSPSAQLSWSLTKQDRVKAQRILNGSEPFLEYQQQTRTLQLSERDLNIVANYLFNLDFKSTSKIDLNKNAMHLAFSAEWPNYFFGSYVNVSFDMPKEMRKPVIINLLIGKLKIPDEFGNWVVGRLIELSNLDKYYILGHQHIKKVEFKPALLIITHDWTVNTFIQAKEMLFKNDAHRKLIMFYQNMLEKIITEHDRNWLLSLADILKPMFKAAYDRSVYLDPIEENKAILFVVSSYVNKLNIQSMMPWLSEWETIAYHPVFIYKRIDMVEHFMGSALLAATGSGYIASVLGREKELSDSHKGSGFSFVDLAADRAGIHFGSKATLSRDDARKLQKAMADIKNYDEFMPDVTDLPEHIDNKKFFEQFISIYSTEYRSMVTDIDQRIAACPIYENL